MREPDAGATLRVLLRAESGLAVTVAAQALDQPSYQRAVRLDRGSSAALRGLGAGRFRVTVWDRFTGLRLHSEEVVSAGRGEIAVTIPLE